MAALKLQAGDIRKGSCWGHALALHVCIGHGLAIGLFVHPWAGHEQEDLVLAMSAMKIAEPVLVSHVFADVLKFSQFDLGRLDAVQRWRIRCAPPRWRLGTDSGSGCCRSKPLGGSGLDMHIKAVEQDGPRLLQGDKKEDSGSVSGDTIAIVVTAILGVGSFILQARVTKQADVTARDIEQSQSEHDRQRAHASVQLEQIPVHSTGHFCMNMHSRHTMLASVFPAWFEDLGVEPLS